MVNDIQVSKKSSLVEELANVGSLIQESWSLCKQYSDIYISSLGFNDINDPKLKVMYDNDGAIAVETKNYGTIHLFIKNTCGPNGWQTVMQARTTQSKVEGIGGGTRFFAILNPQEHFEVLQAINNNKLKLVKKTIWP